MSGIPPSGFPTPGPMTELAFPAAVAALIVDEQGHYLLQRRDEKPGIWFPGYCSLFGGLIEEGEEPEEALLRELAEELDFRPRGFAYFTQIGFDLRRWERGIKLRYVYEVPATAAEIAGMTLNEGQRIERHPPETVMGIDRIAPYDAVAIGLHMARRALEQAPRLA